MSSIVLEGSLKFKGGIVMFMCCICGYDELEEPQYKDDYATFTICSCCGFESGFDDDAVSKPLTFEEYRNKWIELGAPWFSSSKKPSVNWDYKTQLKRINAIDTQK